MWRLLVVAPLLLGSWRAQAEPRWALQLVEHRGLEPGQVNETLLALVEALRRVADVTLDDLGEPCDGGECVAHLAARNEAEAVVLVRLLDGVGVVRVEVDRVEVDHVSGPSGPEDPSFGARVSIAVELPRTGPARGHPAFEVVARALGPPAAKPLVLPVAPPPPPEPGPGRAIAIVLLSIGGGALASAIGTRVAAEADRGEAARWPEGSVPHLEAEDRGLALGLASNLLFGVAIALVAGSTGYLVAAP